MSDLDIVINKAKQSRPDLEAEINALAELANQAGYSAFVVPAMKKMLDKLCNQRSPQDRENLQKMTASLSDISKGMNAGQFDKRILFTSAICFVVCALLVVGLWKLVDSDSVYFPSALPYALTGIVFGALTFFMRYKVSRNISFLNAGLAGYGLFEGIKLLAETSLDPAWMLYIYLAGMTVAIYSAVLRIFGPNKKI